MFCRNCGSEIPDDAIFCNKCGTNITNNIKPVRKSFIWIIMPLITILIVGIAILIYGVIRKPIYITDNTYESNEIEEENVTPKSDKKIKTAIVYDNQYTKQNIKSEEDAVNLVKKDSQIQREKYDSTKISKVEESLQKNYGIIAVNLGELDINLAQELENVIKNIYNEFPSIRGSLTNLTLKNGSLRDSSIASFEYCFTFADSNTKSTFPWILKNQIVLNTSYFFNLTRLENTIKDASNSGHFPKNANRYSPVAHELGHYVSFTAMLNYYNIEKLFMIKDTQIEQFYKVFDDFNKGIFSKKIIDEAYTNYLNKNKDMDITQIEFIGSISNYALAKDQYGNYIYDETIAEAFHDWYLNKDNASEASIEIVNVLKGYLR